MYPVLDDSDDETYDILKSLVADYQKEGFDILHVRRGNRKGYKAGALRHAMSLLKVILVAIFDADFIPPRDFSKRHCHILQTRNRFCGNCRGSC